jgi:hypothetical protein
MKITRRRRHVRGGAGVEVPIGGAGRSLGVDASGLQSGGEGTVIPDAGGGMISWCRELLKMLRRHGLLGLKKWMGAQDTGCRGAEGHAPSLHKTRPRVVGGSLGSAWS